MKLKVGDVFKFVNPSFPDKPPHPKIVVAITDNRRIIYVYTSSQQASVKKFSKLIEKPKQGSPQRTYVEANVTDCPALTGKSYINCNYVFEIDEYSLTRDSSYVLMTDGAANQDLLSQIKVGVLCSPNVSFKTKQQLLK